MVSRRRAVLAFSANVLAAPLGVFAQQKGKVWRIGLLVATTREKSDTRSTRGFLEGLRELGYIEGRNLTIDRRFADDVYDRLPGLAKELAKLQVDVIVAYGGGVSAAQQATKTIPIVGVFDNPVGNGFAASLSRPGGNITGLAVMTRDLDRKRLELLSSVLPKNAHIEYLWKPSTMDEVAAGISLMVKQSAGGVLVADAGFYNFHAREIGELATRHKLPSCFAEQNGADGGGLMSYGVDYADILRRAATYVGKILKEEKPGDIPIEQASKFVFVVNLKTAKALGVTIPQSMLISADRVIE